MNRRPKPKVQHHRRGFPSGFRKIVIDSETCWFKVGDKYTEIRAGGKKWVTGNWVLKGMSEKDYFHDRYTHGFWAPEGCECDTCDMGICHLRHDRVIKPADVAKAIRGNM